MRTPQQAPQSAFFPFTDGLYVLRKVVPGIVGSIPVACTFRADLLIASGPSVACLLPI